MMRSKIDQQQQQITNLSKNKNGNLNRTVLDDDKALEIIELTLHKYQNFLDFLRNAGFGKLIDINEMNQLEQQELRQEQQLYIQKQQQQQARLAKQNVKPSSRSPTRPASSKNYSKPQSPSASPTRQYYSNKINKAKTKLNNFSINESTIMTQNEKIFDASLLNDDNQNIDDLVTNALEISRSYRRFNSSSVNNSAVNLISTKNYDKRLSNIKEANKENSAAFNEYDSTLPDFNELESKTKILLDEYQNVRAKANSSNSNKQISPASSSNRSPERNLSGASGGKSQNELNSKQSTATTSPQTTIIVNSNKLNSPKEPPIVSARTSIGQQHSSSLRSSMNDESQKSSKPRSFVKTKPHEVEEDEEEDDDDNNEEVDHNNISEILSDVEEASARHRFNDMLLRDVSELMPAVNAGAKKSTDTVSSDNRRKNSDYKSDEFVDEDEEEEVEEELDDEDESTQQNDDDF